MRNNTIWFLGALAALVVAWVVMEQNRRKVDVKTAKAITAFKQVDGLGVETETAARQGSQVFVGPEVVPEPPSPLMPGASYTEFGFSYSKPDEYLRSGGTAIVSEIHPDEKINAT